MHTNQETFYRHAEVTRWLSPDMDRVPASRPCVADLNRTAPEGNHPPNLAE